METRVTEVADGVHQLTTHIPEIDFGFNQYLLAAEEPLLFHTGMRGVFPLVSGAIARVLPPRPCAGSPSATSRRTSAAR